MSDGSTTVTMNLKETEDSFKVTVTGGDSDGYFLADKVAGTIYSSYTGKTIKVNQIAETSQPGIQLTSTKELVSKRNYDISYKQLADLVGTTAGLYAIASGIISIIGVAYGRVLVTIPAAIYSFLKGELLATILAGIKTKAGNHGVRVTVGTIRAEGCTMALLLPIDTCNFVQKCFANFVQKVLAKNSPTLIKGEKNEQK